MAKHSLFVPNCKFSPEADGELDPRLTFVDFTPRCAGIGQVICSPDYERFDVLMRRANDWLKRRPGVTVRTCESIEVKGRLDGYVDSEKGSYYEPDHAKRRNRNIYIRALRLWLLPSAPTPPAPSPIGEVVAPRLRRSRRGHYNPQQIGYINVVPSRSKQGAFESFGNTVEKFNKHLDANPIPGHVLNIESQEVKFHDWGQGRIDPDESCWVENVKSNVCYLVVIRLFFQVGESRQEQIGCADFVPLCKEVGSQFANASFESFEEVASKSRAWISEQCCIRITNVQSIDYKLLHATSIAVVDTQRSFFVESGRETTSYIRIIRVCYVRGVEEFESRKCDVNLTYATFTPFLLSSGGIIGIPLFQTVPDTVKRLQVWLGEIDPEISVLSVETVAMRMCSGNSNGLAEVTHTWNRAEVSEYWIMSIRVFLSGEFDISPEDMFSETSSNVETSCQCVIA